ncbi:centrosomal protein of 290 kDa [Colletes gigas]|uniref:centrosomal protein of 290 kDa n=1 Tax=Colletes gigas TaxID=935657 RepID=UPI001C9B8628|nr:centrosomal protein of 290 kDa [Colletes gigas]
MGRTDLDRILSIDPSSLTDDDIEDLYPAMISCDVDEISNLHNLRVLVKLSQEILQYKDNQVESLLLECGKLKETITSLEPESAKRRKKDWDTSDIKHGTGNLSKHSDISESADYDDELQGKNNKIKILMTELESLEKDNVILKEQLTTLTQEMEDATQKMNEMTEELSSAQMKSVESKAKISYLEQENTALVAQIEEITAQQIDRDRVIDEFGAAIDTRINEWKAILDGKDAEIQRLQENLSQSVMQSVTSVKEQNKSEIVHLNEELELRDKIMTELKTKLSEAVDEINEGATLIEKLKADAQKVGKNNKKKQHKDLLKKLQDANEQVSNLQIKLSEAEEDARLRSSKLCEVLATLRKYEDENQSLTDALNEIKVLQSDQKDRNAHIKDLVNVVNKLEMLNSYQEMEIITLREKLGLPEDESVCIQSVLEKRKKETKKLEVLMQQNKILAEENLEMKSDIRILKYKLSKTSKVFDFSDNTVDGSTEFLHSTKLPESELQSLYPKAIMQQDMQLVLEENEALRTGMHEILDSIRNQDGKSVVEVQSSTLERLLEALDVRHLAGWYHPAMRLQEHLNVVQGSNAELRGQLKQLRKELQRKDKVFQTLALHNGTEIEKMYAEESDSEKTMMYISEMRRLQEAYANEADEWEKQKDSLAQQNDELSTEIEKLKLQLDIYEQSLKTFEESDGEVRKAFAIKTKEYAEAASEILIVNRNNAALQQLLNKETMKSYEDQKEAIKNETYLRRAYADTNKHNKVLEREISMLQSNLSNSISKITYNELKEKHDELNIRYRNLLENDMLSRNDNETEILTNDLELLKQEKNQLIELLQKDFGRINEEDLTRQLKEAKANELLEKQRADHVTSLHEILQVQLSKSEENVKEAIAAKSELQEELIILHKRLSKDACFEKTAPLDDNRIQELKDNNAALQLENEKLTKLIQISEEAAERQYSLNTLNTLELDNLRHQILDLQAVSEDKATISRLNFELTSKTTSEMELNSQKTRLENETSCLQEELDKARTTCEGLRSYVQDCRKQCESRCRTYVDIIGFLQNQYAGSSSISALDRIASLSFKLRDERRNIDSELKNARECRESAKVQQETLTNRLQIVESLKDILEQQIGSNSVQDIVQRFSEYSQYTLNDFKYKRKITQLEYELQIANNKFMEYDELVTSMEQDMIQTQKVWAKGQDQEAKVDTRNTGTSPVCCENKHESVQATTTTKSGEIQTDPYNCCLEKKDTSEAEIQTASPLRRMGLEGESPSEEKKIEQTERTGYKDVETKQEEKLTRSGTETEQRGQTMKTNAEVEGNSGHEVSLVREQLSQTLKIASERSATLVKYESQIAEYQRKVETLNKTIESKDSQLTQKETLLEEYRLSSQSQPPSVDHTDKLALKSTINSLQRLVGQKEETIARYQNLLKEDRDEHSRAAARLQAEIKSLHARIQAMQTEVLKSVQQKSETVESEKLLTDELVEIAVKTDAKSNAMQTEEAARLREKVSTLEANLNITKELSDRWHLLAEERLGHMDRMRERLEEQHKNELESYREELKKWQSETDVLRKQLAENRMLLTKGNISLMKEMQERDSKIHELSLACQQLENEVELRESATRSQRAITHCESERKTHEITLAFSRDQSQQQAQTEIVRKQLQSLLEKEKTYKNEISDLKQQLSRRYMAVKSQEKKTSQRETQLERKVKSLEEELERARTRLDREYLAQEAKKAKTAEELSLWEKQKRWQQTAEKLKEKLKEKTDEYGKLLLSYDKLRSVVMCMEREKWNLKSKRKMENSTIAGGLSARPITTSQQNLTDEFQKECQTLRDRIKELTDRLENEDNEKLLLKIEEQKRRIAALEIVSQGNSTVAIQLEKLQMAKDILEKMNLAFESENFELRLELEKANSNVPRLREKIEHLEKYIELLKVEKSSDSSPRLLDKDIQDHGTKKSTLEMEKTIFTLKRIIEKLQVENKRLRTGSKASYLMHQGKFSGRQSESILQKQYEEAQKRVVALETDLQLAEQRLAAFEKAQREDDSGEIMVLKEQLSQKSELLDKVKHLLSRAAVNEKSLRQRVQQLESRQALSIIPECYVTPATAE